MCLWVCFVLLVCLFVCLLVSVPVHVFAWLRVEVLCFLLECNIDFLFASLLLLGDFMYVCFY